MRAVNTALPAETTRGDPCDLADALLRAACAQPGRWLRLAVAADDQYRVSTDAAGRVHAGAPISRALAAATLARLALIARLDPMLHDSGSARLHVRAPDGESHLIVTLRTGAAPEVEILALHAEGAQARAVVIAPGAMVGPYRLQRRLGAGAMGEVYACEHVVLERRFALKVMAFDQTLDRTSIDQFLCEARAAARVRHPNVVDVIDVGYLPGQRPYLVMELLDLVPLDSLGDQPLPLGHVIAIARQAAAGLAAAHRAGVVHGDVSTGNILVSQGQPSELRVVDFGLAQIQGRRAITGDGYVVGTPRFMAPEQIRGGGVSEATDQYSLGVILYELLSGRPLFPASSLRTLCLQHLTAQPAPCGRLGAPSPPVVSAVVTRMLAKDPRRRFPSMAGVEEAFAALGAQHPLEAP